jgi:hypothetical protein
VCFGQFLRGGLDDGTYDRHVQRDVVVSTAGDIWDSSADRYLVSYGR